MASSAKKVASIVKDAVKTSVSTGVLPGLPFGLFTAVRAVQASILHVHICCSIICSTTRCSL